MEVTKLILLSCSILFACSKGDDAPAVEKEDQLEEATEESGSSQNYRIFKRFNELTNSLRQCFCLLQKPTGVPVIQKLNPNGEKLERLVIYFYKDESSDYFKMYLPNYEKQLVIPDLALDQGDVLEVWPSDEIESIFNKYPDLKTNRNTDLIPDITQIVDPETFNDEKSPQDLKETLNPNNNDISSSEQPIYTSPTSPMTPDEDQIKKNYGEFDDFSDSTNNNRDPDVITDNMEYDTEKSKPDVSEDPNELEDKDLEEKAIKVVHINQNFDLNTKPGKENEITQDDAVTPNSNHNYNININLDLSNGDEDAEPPNKSEGTPQPYEHELNDVPQEELENPEPVTHEDLTWPESPNSNIISVPTNPMIWNTVKPVYIPPRTSIKKIINYLPERKIIDTIPTQNPKIWHHTLYDPNQRKIVTAKPIDQPDIKMQETFDNWLVHQLERVQFAESQAAHTIDIYTLKYLIERTLRKSGFFIATNGLLVDSKGVKIHMANLALRPILIGDSVKYQKLMKGKAGTFKLPNDLPYLEAVLITSINPQKILGIVELGKTYLPRDFSTLYVQGLQQGGCNKCRIQDSQLYQKRFIPSHPSQWITNYSPYLKKQLYGPSKISQTPTSFAVQGGQVGGIHRVFPFDQINTLLGKLYKVPLPVNKVKYIGRPYVVDYSVQPVMTKETYHGVPVVKYPISVTPGFRIIGGNAATSSGTPVSSKGRSGVEPEAPKSAAEE